MNGSGERLNSRLQSQLSPPARSRDDSAVALKKFSLSARLSDSTMSEMKGLL